MLKRINSSEAFKDLQEDLNKSSHYSNKSLDNSLKNTNAYSYTPPKAGPLPMTSVPKDTFSVVPMKKSSNMPLNIYKDSYLNKKDSPLNIGYLGNVDNTDKDYFTDRAYAAATLKPFKNKTFNPDDNLSGFTYYDNKYKRMTPIEKQIFTSLYESGQKERAREYLNSIDKELNERSLGENSDTAKFYKEWANKNKIAGTILNVGSGALDFGGGLVEAAKKVGTGEGLDVNSPSYLNNKLRNWTNEGVTKDMGQAGKFLYNVGTSIGQTALRLPLGAPGLALAGLSAGSQSAYDAAQRGASAEQALLSGTASGIVEGIMEKIPLDSLRLLKNAPPDAARSFAKVILKQSGIEATEETLTEFTNAILDKAIMGDKSNFALTKNQYLQNGLNDTDAGTRAYFDTFFKQPAVAGLGGALSGGVLGAGGYGLNSLRNRSVMQSNQNNNIENETLNNVPQSNDTIVKADVPEVSELPTQDSVISEIKSSSENDIAKNPKEMNIDEYRKIKRYVRQLKEKGENIPEIKRLSGIIEDVEGYMQYYNMEAGSNTQKYANKLVKELDEIYSFNSRKNSPSNKEVLNAIYKITSNIKENENFSRDDIKLLEDTAFEQGFVKNIDDVKRNEGVKSWLRGLRLYVSPEIKGSIPDYNDFRKSLTGKIGGLTTTDKKALSVDTAYQELHGMYPELFPGTIINETEQLQQIKEVADSLVIRKTPLSEAWQNNPDASYTRLKNAARSDLVTALETYRKSVMNDRIKAWNKAFEQYNSDVKKGKFGAEYADKNYIPDISDDELMDSDFMAQNTDAESLVNSEETEGSVLDFLLEDEDTPFGQNTVGSAQYNPNSLQSLGEKYGVIKEGENPVSTERVVQIPKSIDGKTKVSKTARTAAENPYFDNDTEATLEQEILSGSFNYTPETNANLMKNAEDTLNRLGFDGALSHWRENINDGKAINDSDIALINRLINESAAAKNTNLTMELLAEYAAVGTRIGKAMQAQRLLKRSTPTGQLYYIQKTIDNYNKSNKSRKRSSREVTLNQELATQFLNAPDEATREKIAEQMYLDVAEQLPFSWLDQWNNWRYFAMLGNSRTHIRNFFGNVIFLPVRQIKNTIGAGIESAVNTTLKKQGKEGITRTKTLNHFSDTYKTNYRFAKELFDTDSKIFMGDAKYGINEKIERSKNKVPFKLKNKKANTIANAPFTAFNKVSDLNSRALEFEDKIFFKQAFADSLASYMTVNNMNPDIANIPRSKGDNDKYNKAIAYATKEAQKATYRDESALANYITEFSRKNKLTKFLVESVIPFKKTPINILKRGVEYSPGGLIKGMSDVFTKVRNGEMEAAEAIDEIAAGLTGTAIVALGAFFASKGLISGIGEDEKKLRDLESAEGYQNYSFNLGDWSETIDWMAPTALPLFVGVELYNSMKEDNADFSFERFIDAYTKVSEPMFNLSVISGFRDLLSSITYAEKGDILPSIAGSMATNYLGQAVPTLFGQIARTIDPTRRTYYPDKNSKINTEAQRFVQRQEAKIPGLSQNLEPYLDVWGNEDREDNDFVRFFDNFINPGYLSKRVKDPVNEGLRDIYDATGELDVLPSKPQKYSEVNGKRKDYTGPEYTTATRLKGQTAYNSIRDVMNSNTYNSMTPEEKRGVIKDIYEYSNAITRDELDDNYEVESWVTEVNNGVKETGMSAGEIMLYRDMINGITKGDKVAGKSKAELQDELIHNLNISTNSKNWLSKNFVTRGTFIPDNETVVDHSSHENFVISQMSQSAQKLYNNYAWQFVDENEYTKIYEALKDGDSDEKKSRLLNMGYPRDFVNRIVDLKNNPEKLGE